MASGVSRLAVWWRQPDHYDWLAGYLASRHLHKFVRLFVAATTATFGAITLAMTWSPAGPDRRGGLHCSAAVSGVVHGDGCVLGVPVADATAIDLLRHCGRWLHGRCLSELL